jgi:alkylation response protein AidB-like acyl-CoA dehydrogenase
MSRFGLAPAAAASEPAALQEALAVIAATAAARDRSASPAFPDDAITRLEDAGALAFNAVAGYVRPPAAEELGLVRAVARADASVGRIFDGHLNGVERLAVQAPPALRDAELAAVRDRRLRVGVWGGDPRPGEGPRATVQRGAGTETLSGVKTFCSGAGGLDRALVLARDPDASAPAAVWIDLTDETSVTVDEGWYRSSGLRASVSHRVVFDRAPVLARFGPPGGLSQQPWFARDALRTAASWAGMADRALDAALDVLAGRPDPGPREQLAARPDPGPLEQLAGRPDPGPLEQLAAGRMLTAQQTIDAWLQRAARAMDAAEAELPEVALHARVAIAHASRELLDEAARACGSHPFATGGELDRARRDLELFLLQHRLDPALAAAGARALDARAEEPS